MIAGTLRCGRLGRNHHRHGWSQHSRIHFDVLTESAPPLKRINTEADALALPGSKWSVQVRNPPWWHWIPAPHLSLVTTVSFTGLKPYNGNQLFQQGFGPDSVVTQFNTIISHGWLYNCSYETQASGLPELAAKRERRTCYGNLTISRLGAEPDITFWGEGMSSAFDARIQAPLVSSE